LLAAKGRIAAATYRITAYAFVCWQVMKDIKLASQLALPRHAVQLTGTGGDAAEFLLCHGYSASAYGVCVVDGNGRITKSSSSSSAAAAASGDGGGGGGGAKSWSPTHVAVDGCGSVLVAEFSGGAVQIYGGKNLDRVGDVDCSALALQQPFRLCVDQTSGRLYVGEFAAGQARVLVFARHG